MKSIGIREEIEQELEKSLSQEIEDRVLLYRDELKLMTAQQEGSLRSPKEIEHTLKEKREQIKKELMCPEDRKRIDHGFQIILERLSSKETLSELKNSTTVGDLTQIPEDTEVQDLLGLSNETCNAFYTIGLDVMKEGIEVDDVESPLSVFLYLTQLNRYFYEPHLLLGYCYMYKGEYSKALNAFWNASSLDPESLEPFYRSAECYIALNLIDKAKEVLTIMKEELTDSPDYPKYQKGINQLINSLESENRSRK